MDAEKKSTEPELEQAVREYYLRQEPAERAEDASWGEALARDSKRAWDED